MKTPGPTHGPGPADGMASTNLVDVAIGRLRAKLDVPFERALLHTVRGMGYVLEERGE